MKNRKKLLRAAFAVTLVIGIMLAYSGVMGVVIVPGIHAFGAKLDYVTLEDPSDLKTLTYRVSGAQADAITDNQLAKLTRNKHIVALSEAIPEYVEAHKQIQAELDAEYNVKLANVQALIDDANAAKTAKQKQVVAQRKLITAAQADELDALNAELDNMNAELSILRAEYDALIAQKDIINAEKQSVKARSSANDDTISAVAGLAELAAAFTLGNTNFSYSMDYLANTYWLWLIIAGALLAVISIILRARLRVEAVSNLPEELKSFGGGMSASVERKKFNIQKLLAPAALVIMFAFFSLVGESFRTLTTMKAILENSYYVGFLAFGVTFVIMTGGIDLSLGTNMICSALIGCYAYSSWGWPLWLAIWIVPIVATLIGTLNGVLVAKLKLPPFIATLGTQMITIGLGQIVTGVTTQYYPTINSANTWFKTATFRVGGYPIGAAYLIAAFLIASFLLTKTKFGRYTLAIGSNEEAARLSGVNTDRWKILVYAVCGLFVGFAGIFYAAVNTVIIPGYGGGQEVNGIAAVVIGGTSMSGGTGTVVGTIIGVFIMSVLKSGLSSVGLQSHWQTFFTGFVVIGAVLLDQLRTSSSMKVKGARKNIK